MNTLVITVADNTLHNLEQQAHSAGKSSAQIAAELIEDVFGSTVNGKEAENTKTIRDRLYETGLFEPLGDELRSLIIPGVTLAEVREILSSVEGPSLSEILDEHRGPRG
ncbi:MAG: hypothetical protein HY328_10090 [Chloroflexi bacterium]|nr:hypothetical protein [Chloroflexota bacterium]